VKEFIEELRAQGFRVALGSASKNAVLILHQINMRHHFDAIIDGTRVVNAKPDPEVFLLAARDLTVPPGECVVFEDAEAGIEAALRGGMRCVGVGDPAILGKANMVIPNFKGMTVERLRTL
jgi:beta-phosphoglucomutase